MYTLKLNIHLKRDLIQNKVRNNIEDINWQVGPLNAPHTSTRGESHTAIYVSSQRNDFRHFGHGSGGIFFLNRVVNEWNRLASLQITAPSVNSFKSRIDI